MVQGTSSHAGKSLVVTALCALFRREGWRVAPFKAVNMSLNAFAAPDGEMAWAQAIQARAAGREPSVDMNPVLLKPSRPGRAQLVVRGRVWGEVGWPWPAGLRRRLWQAVAASWRRLRERADVLVIEGAGSPVEVNLLSHDLANMRVARMAGAPVLLVGDIERGGLLASFVGTMELLPPEDRERVAGLLINKFRGERALLAGAIRFLEERTGVPVLGVLPWRRWPLGEEDSLGAGWGEREMVGSDGRYGRERGASGCQPDLEEDGTIHGGWRWEEAEAENPKIALSLIRLPYLSNFTDFRLLEGRRGIAFRWVAPGESLGRPDAVILPGSKSPTSDLRVLWQSGLGREIRRLFALGVPVVGICGGYQMMGRVLRDPLGLEGEPGEVEGLGILPVETEYLPEKVVSAAGFRVQAGEGPFASLRGRTLWGYQIRRGRLKRTGGVPLFALDGEEEGCLVACGRAWGTHFHDLFAREEFLEAFLGWLAGERHGLIRAFPRPPGGEDLFAELGRWAEEHLDWPRLRDLVLHGQEKRRS
jgi:adenosylcobyric acid synthase